MWTTDKDGIAAALLAAEMTARGNDPGELYQKLTRQFGVPVYIRTEAPATSLERATIARLTAQNVEPRELAGEKILSILTSAPGDGHPIGGLKVVTDKSWFAARPSGTEAIYKIYAETFSGADHLEQIQEQAQAIIARAWACS